MTGSAAASGAAPGAAARKATALAVPLLGIMGGIQTADPTIASTALVESARALQMDAGLQAIAASISTLMLAATVITTGLLADRIGRRLLLVLALALSALGDLIVAVAVDPALFLTGRALAGVGLGAVYGASFAYIRAVVPQGKIAAAMGSFAAFNAVSMIVVSFIGGSLASVDWRLAFIVVPVVTLISISAVLAVLPRQPRSARGPADVAGQVVLALGIVGVLYGISHAGAGMTSPLTWAPLLAGLVLLVLFVIVEKRGAHPFFPIELFRNPGFLAAVGMGIAFNFAQAVGILQLANIWQYVYGFSTVEVSLGQLPVTVISVAASIYIGRRLSAGLSPATAIVISGAASVLGFLAFALILISHEFWFFLPGMLLIGFGMSGLVPYGALVLRLAPPAQFGAVTSSRTTIGQFGYAVGLSGSMILVDAITREGVIHRLKDAGVTPARYGEALDAIYAYAQNGTVPSGDNGTALLQGAAASYEVAFVTTMVVTAAIVGVLSLLTVFALRRFERTLPASKPTSPSPAS